MKEETKENRKQMLSAFVKAKDERFESEGEGEKKVVFLMYRV